MNWLVTCTAAATGISTSEKKLQSLTETANLRHSRNESSELEEKEGERERSELGLGPRATVTKPAGATLIRRVVDAYVSQKLTLNIQHHITSPIFTLIMRYPWELAQTC